jgi:Holliday junction DNA helicase RuvB
MDFNKFIGQTEIKCLIASIIKAAKIENRPIPHTLFRATRGMGKTTFCEIILANVSHDYNTYRFSTGGVDKDTIIKIIGESKKQKDNGKKTIIFVDEIHQLNTETQEALYDPMTHSTIFDGGERKLNPFTIIGATTDSGKLLQPFRDRFSCTFSFTDYTQDEMLKIITEYNNKRNGGKYKIHKNILLTIAQRGKDNPRITKAIYDRIIDECIVNNSCISTRIIGQIFSLLGIDAHGLTGTDRQILKYLSTVGTAGQNHITSVLDIDNALYIEEIEPFLVKNGFIIREPRGRRITEKGLMAI